MEVLGPFPTEQPPLSTLRSRFGRRLLLLFIGCALLPAIALTILSAVTVNRQLEREATLQLRHTADAVSTALLERLLSVQSDLDGLAPIGSRVRASDSLRLARRAGPLRYKLLGLQFLLGEEHSVPLFRAVEEAGEFDSVVTSLKPGTARLVVRRAPGTMPRVVLVRALAATEGGRRAALLAELDPGFLWGGLREQTRSTTMEVVVLDEGGEPLYGPPTVSTVQGDVAAAIRGLGADTFTWRARGETYLAARHSLFISGRFVTPRWNVVLRESRADVLAPIASYTRTFPLVVLLCAAAALLVGLTQIRRAVAPLRALQDGTRRIAHNDFQSRVTVQSRDEFAELASSFNAMAGTLGQQFRALGTAAEIDRAVLSAIDAVAIVDTILERARDVYSCDVIAVTLAVEGGAGQSFVEDASGAAGRRVDRVIIAPEDAARLQVELEPVLVPLDPGARIAPHLVPLVRHGARAALVVPLVFKDELIGLIALGDATPRAPSAEEITRARRLAAQTAVALANARMVERVRSLAYYDGVTGLPNRVLYRELLQRALDRGRDEGRQVGVCFVDLDHFGRINDTLGHDIGDQLLREVAGRLTRACRGDQGTDGRRGTPAAAEDVRAEVARWGGDEFTAILPGLRGARDAVLVAQRILNAFTQPFQLAGHEVFVAASIGIALAPDDGEDVEALLKHADVAMYHAKEQGRNVFRLYSRAMHSAALEWIELERDMRRALPSEEMVLHYQPIVDAKTGRIVAAEALVRWQHPQRGLLGPTQFIPIAEESGLILPLGEWILHTACQQLRSWQEDKLPPIRLSVNVSGRQLRDPSLTETILQALRESGVAPGSLTLELTESLLMEHGDTTVELLRHWRQLGLGLSIDDFGTGYSSLGYLKHFPIDALKIDRAFVRDVATAAGDAAITTAVLALGHALDLRVVAEGVETEAQLAFLRQQGCDLVQGFLIGRPMPAEEFTRRLRADRDPKARRTLARLA